VAPSRRGASLMRFVPRLLPLLIGAAALLLCAKVVDFWFAIGIGPLATAQAQTTPAPAALAPAKPEPVKPGRTAAADPTSVAGKRAVRDPMAFSPQEVEILQSLAQRRDELDRRAAEVDRHEALLQATEQRIDEKIAKLQQMEGTIDATFKKEDQKDDAKIKSLVKIYETMKPKEAARIFEQLDLPVLLDVLENMKELKTAPILASMDPAKAKAVTLALAARHPPPEMKQ
jgi:flagellar motility protein MotE (MotC chaperone)